MRVQVINSCFHLNAYTFGFLIPTQTQKIDLPYAVKFQTYQKLGTPHFS